MKKNNAFFLSTRMKDKYDLCNLCKQDLSLKQKRFERKEEKKKKNLLTFLRSVEGRTSSKVLLESWIAYPASLGERILTFSSLIYTRKLPNRRKKAWDTFEVSNSTDWGN